MDNEQYMTTQIQIAAIAAIVKDLDLEGFINRISHAEACAPIVDPTLWMKGAENLQQIKRLAQAAREFQKVANEVMPK